MAQRVPTTIVTGFLGVGKTTAILDALTRRPAGERWAVVVNEAGEVGVDGAVLSADLGVEVREIAGGCLCCTAGPLVPITLARLLREQRPDRLLIEPSGLASPAVLVDLLRSPSFRDAVDVRATVALVDPRRFVRPASAQDEVFLAQVEVADVLVANRTDLCTPDELAAFDVAAAALWPPRLVVAHTTHGRLDPAWLDLDPVPRAPRFLPLHDPQHGHTGVGIQRGPDTVVSAAALRALAQELLAPGPLLPHGAARLKGVVRTDRGWLLVQGTPDALTTSPTGHRRDVRLEVLAAADPSPDLAALRGRLEALFGAEPSAQQGSG